MSWETTVGGLGTTGVALAVGWWTYKRGRRGDAATAKLAEQTETRTGQQSFIVNLQDDNARLRVRLDIVESQVGALTQELNRLHRKYGENGATPPKGIPST